MRGSRILWIRSTEGRPSDRENAASIFRQLIDCGPMKMGAQSDPNGSQNICEFAGILCPAAIELPVARKRAATAEGQGSVPRRICSFLTEGSDCFCWWEGVYAIRSNTDS